jgi:hypothetical protein
MGALSFLKFWKKDAGQAGARPKSDAALMETVYLRAEERRKHLRISYPSVGAIGELPVVEINGSVMTPGNFSIVGFFVRRSDVNIPPDAGQVHRVTFKWPREGAMGFDAKLVSVGSDTFHFELVKKDFRGGLRLQLAFERVFRSGIRGNSLKPMKASSISPDTGFSEMWMSDLGDFVAFETNQAVICLDGKRIRQNPPASFEFIDADKEGNWKSIGEVTREFADEVILFLTNLKRPSPRVTEVLRHFVARFHSEKK